eukprot:TRINITY_DN13956_c0_g1_i1.p1 TRINITY_DN13956_c0_g1~~TRINITY_DN13956_c0_g1_i1.p1  ORF type:complete len:420 (-),score=88.23 TRINITY_DN13956_c0_g1_i1:40-1227(-)
MGNACTTPPPEQSPPQQPKQTPAPIAQTSQQKPASTTAAPVVPVQKPVDKPVATQPVVQQPSAKAAPAEQPKKESTVYSGDLLAKNYDIIKVLGRGAYATVSLARHKETGKEWAVKVIDFSKMDLAEDKWMLDNEVDILRRIHHPHITSLHEIYRSRTNLSLVMDLCKGGELFEQIVKRGHYSEEDARRIMAEIVSAVEYLHANGVVHRDIKPENLLLVDESPEAAVQLTDFGLSGIAKKSDMSLFVGTPQYMAPEVLDEVEYGAPVDMWSVGVVLFVLLAGYLPFDAEDDDTLFSAIRSSQPAYHLYPSLWRSVSDGAKDLIGKLFVRDPLKRLTATQALQHPWLKNQASTAHLGGAVELLSKYNARRKLKAAMNTVRLVTRLTKMGGFLSSSN